MGCASSIDRSDGLVCALPESATGDDKSLVSEGEDYPGITRTDSQEKLCKQRARRQIPAPLAPWPEGDGPWSASCTTRVPLVIFRAPSNKASESHQASFSSLEKRCFPEYPMNNEEVITMLQTSHVFFAYVVLTPEEYLAFSDGRADDPVYLQARSSNQQVRLLAGCVAVRYSYGKMNEVLSLAVDPSFQGMGIASILLSTVLSVGGSWQLHVCVHNYVARRLYKRHGFRATALARNYYPDGTGAFIMRCHMQDDA
mmetsp:Transcript_116110/g.201580  ORF Transcript_116110/g.201580 Transcript_116110/m.201580 type:complete len:256 (-) Transcript_116110:70-837(-)